MSPTVKIKMGRARPIRWFALLVAGLCVVLASATAQAQSSNNVETIGGGVRTECGVSYGFVGGNTYTGAQFNGPYSCALDTNGNLWIADRTNSDIEQITQAGNKTGSQTFQIFTLSSYFTTNGKTVTTHYVTNFHAFTNVTAVAVDPANNLYITLPSPPQVIKSSLATETTSLNILSALQFYNYTNNGAPAVPSAMAVDANSNVFLAFTNGSIVKFQMLDSNPPPTLYTVSYGGGLSPALHYIVSNGFPWRPAGLALTAAGQLAVTDTSNNAVWVVATNDYTVNPGPQLLTGGLHGPGFDDGIPAFAQFDQPTGIAASSDGRLIICDTMNNRLRVIDALTNTTTLYGTSSNVWTKTCCSCDPALYAGWVDGSPGQASNSAAGRLPVSCTIATNGSIFVTELYYNLIREVQNTSFTPVNTSASSPVAITEPASGISSTNATLNGIVTPGQEVAYYYFEYGTNASYGSFTATNQISSSLTASQNVSLTLTQLLPGTAYHFQLVAYNGLGYSYGGDVTVITPAEPAVLSTLPATSITVSNAILNASVNPEYSGTTVYFQWGTSTNFGNTTTPITITSNLSSYTSISQPINNLQGATIYYFQAVAFNAGGVTYGNMLVFGTPYLPPPTISFTPSNGYFPNCVVVTVTSSSPYVYYSTNGTAPTTNSPELGVTFNGTNYIGYYDWCNPQANLSQLQFLAGTGTNTAVAIGSASTTNAIGFPQPLVAGPGETLYVPVVMNLASPALESVQFRVEINPTPPNTNTISSVTLQPLTPDDMIVFPGPAASDAPVTFTNFAYPTSSNGTGLVVTGGGSSGLDMTSSGVIVMLHFTVPTNATLGQTYTLNVLIPSGTSDGQQASIPISPLPAQTLTITDPPYMVGDSSPGFGYNATQFGNGALDNSDVNNAIYASAGIRLPPSDSDIFNAMDAWPPDSAGHGGDDQITLLDWETILSRSIGVAVRLGIDTNNYIRYWETGDDGFPSHEAVNWYPGGPPVPLIKSRGPRGPRPKYDFLTPPGLVWNCQASVGAGTVTNALPGNTYSLPVYAKVNSGDELAALQFRARVTNTTGGPAVGSIQFTPAAGIPYPQVFPGLSGADKVVVWGFGSFALPLQGSNYLGTISFQVPAGASLGATYALHFSGVDGAPGDSEYEMESFPGFLSVMSTNTQVPSITSDEWKIFFFGSYSNPQAADNVDADGDGALNWQEYVAGTDPTDPYSKLRFTGISPATNSPNAIAMSWLTAPSKTYVLQSSPSLRGSGWTPVNTNTGDGNPYECIVTNGSGNAHFYKICIQP